MYGVSATPRSEQPENGSLLRRKQAQIERLHLSRDRSPGEDLLCPLASGPAKRGAFAEISATHLANEKNDTA